MKTIDEKLNEVNKEIGYLYNEIRQTEMNLREDLERKAELEYARSIDQVSYTISSEFSGIMERLEKLERIVDRVIKALPESSKLLLEVMED